MVTVKIVERSRHAAKTLGRIDGNSFGRLETVTRLYGDAGVQRVQSQKHPDVSIAETLSGSLETAGVDKVEAPSLTLSLSCRWRGESKEWVVNMRSITDAAAEAGLTILNRSLDPVHFMGPISLELDHIELDVGQINGERSCSLDRDVFRSVVRDLEAACNCVILGENRVRERGSYVRNVVVKVYGDSRDIAVIAISGRQTGKTGLAIDDLVGLVGECRDSVAVGVRDMNRWETEVTSSNVWEFTTKVAQAVDPSRRTDHWRIHEFIDDASEMVADKITLLANMEQVRRIVASQSKVVAIGGDGCFEISACGISSFGGVSNEEHVPALAIVATPASERPRRAREAVMVARWLVSFSQTRCTTSLLIRLCSRAR